MVGKRREVEQLAELLDAGVDAADAPIELRTLVAVATRVHETSSMEAPSAAFKARLRAELMAAEPAPIVVPFAERMRDALEDRSSQLRYSARAVVASATASTMLGSAGIAVASQEALPGQLLYPIKQATENVRLAFAGGLEETGRLQLQFAQERMEELEVIGLEGDAELVLATLERMDDAAVNGADDMLAAFLDSGEDALVNELTAFTNDQVARLGELSLFLPVEVGGRVDNSLELLRRIGVQVDSVLASLEPCDCDPVAAIGDVRDSFEVIAPGEGPVVADDACDCAASPVPSQTSTSPSSEPSFADEGSTTNEPNLDQPLGGVGTTVEDLLDDIVEPLDVPSEVADPVEDVVGDVGDVLDEADELIDELLGGVGDSLGGLLGN